MGAASPTLVRPTGAVERYFEVSLFLLLLTSVLALGTTGKLDALSTVAPPLLLALKAVRWLRGRAPEISPRAATVLVVLYLLFVPLDLWVLSRALAEGAPNPALYAGLLTTIHLLLFTTVVRLFSARTLRDHVFLALVSFAMMLAAAILTVDTTFLAFFLVFLVLAVSTFVTLEMRRSAAGAVTPRMDAGAPAAGRLRRALRWTSVAVALAALAVGTGIFFVLPRYQTGYLGGFQFHAALMAGFDDTVELGQIGRIQRNPAVVMRVRVEGGPEQGAGLLWRGVALTKFDGRRWFNEPHEPQVVTQDRDGWYGSDIRWIPDSPLHHWVGYSVLLEPIGTSAIFAPHQARGVRGRFSPEVSRGGRRPRGYLLLDPRTHSLTNAQHGAGRIFYEGVSLVPVRNAEPLRAAAGEYPPEVRELNLELPELDPRVAALARQITAAAPTPFDKAAALEQHLRTRFAYTLEQPAVSPEDPLAHFLFERRAGHCEYFATAMTVMLRTLGVPARYVNGFAPGEYNDIGDDFIIRGSDAHSWVEVYFPEHGWFPFDPTPPSGDRQRGWLGRLGLYWDWFELAWSEWVINYDTRQQRTLAGAMLTGARDWAERAQTAIRSRYRAAVRAVRDWQDRAADSPGTVAALVAVLALALVLLRVERLRAWLAARFAGGSAEAQAAREATLRYREMLRQLERRGLRKSPAETPAEFAAALALPELAGPVGRFTELYQAARFGGALPDAAEMSRLLAAIRAAPRRRPA
jgi:transglutaminase-like putative cysteine protease